MLLIIVHRDNRMRTCYLTGVEIADVDSYVLDRRAAKHLQCEFQFGGLGEEYGYGLRRSCKC